MWNSVTGQSALRLGVLAAAAVFLWGISVAAIADCNGTDNPGLCKAYNQASKHSYHPSSSDDGAAEHARREDEKNFKEIDREFDQNNNSSNNDSDNNSNNSWHSHDNYVNQPSYTPPAQSPQHQAAQWRSSGVGAYNNGDWNSAINDFNHALQYSPNDSNLQQWLQAAQEHEAEAQAAAAAAAHQQQLEAQAAAISQAQQQAQTDAENQAQTLQNLASDIAAAESADARGDWQDAYSYWQSASWNSKDNAAIYAAMQHDSEKMDQAFDAQRDLAAQRLRGSGGGTDLGPLRGDALADTGSLGGLKLSGIGSSEVRGDSSALAQLRGMADTGKAAAAAKSDEAAKAESNLGFDTAGITGSGKYEYRVTRTLQTVPAAIRRNPQFQGMIRRVAEFNGERAQVQKQETQVERQLAQNPSPKEKGDLRVTLVTLRQKESNIFNKEATVIVQTQQNLHFNVNVESVITAVSVKPVTAIKSAAKTAQAAAKGDPK